MSKIVKITNIEFLGINPTSNKYGYEIEVETDKGKGTGKTFGDKLDFGVGSQIKFDTNKTDKGLFFNNIEVIEKVGQAPTIKKKNAWGGAKVDLKGVEEALNNIAAAIIYSTSNKDINISPKMVGDSLKKLKEQL